MKNGVESCQGGDHVEVNIEPVSWMNKIRARIAFVTIEPFLFCFFVPSYLSAISVQNLKFEKACRTDLKYTEEQCSDDKVKTGIQSIVDELTIWLGNFQIAIPAMTILYIAAWSDHTGNRKTLMLVPMLGKVLCHFGLCLTTYFFDELSLFVTGLIEMLPTALSGGYHVVIMGSFCHLAEVTPLKTRTFRIGIASVVFILCKPIATIIGQKLKNITSYYTIFGISCSLNVLGLVYTYFRINDVKPIKNEQPWKKKIMNFVNPSNAWRSLRIAFNSGPDRKKILLVIAIHIVIYGPINGEGNILDSYLTHKYKMDSDDIIIFKDYYATLIEASAKLYSLITLVESITKLIYEPMYLTFYKVLYIKMKKEERDRVTDPQSKELYAEDNYITSL